MGMLIEEEVVAGSISGHPGGQLGHICGLCVYQLDGLPLQVQLLWRARENMRVPSTQEEPCWQAGACS